MLSRAGMQLGTSLDTGRTLAALAEILVPAFADTCIVDLVDENDDYNPMTEYGFSPAGLSVEEEHVLTGAPIGPPEDDMAPVPAEDVW